MSASFQSSPALAGTSPASPANAAAASRSGRIALRCGGGKPLRFDGELIAEASSQTSHSPLWHEIQIYECGTGGYVLGLRLCQAPEPQAAQANAATSRALQFEDLDALALWLEQFDPTADLHAGFDVADPQAFAAEITLKAASFRERAALLRAAWRALIGELLYRLETEW